MTWTDDKEAEHQRIRADHAEARIAELEEEVKNAVYYRECRDKWREQAESRQARISELEAEAGRKRELTKEVLTTDRRVEQALRSQVADLLAALEEIATADEDWTVSDTGFGALQAIADRALQRHAAAHQGEGT